MIPIALLNDSTPTPNRYHSTLPQQIPSSQPYPPAQLLVGPDPEGPASSSSSSSSSLSSSASSLFLSSASTSPVTISIRVDLPADQPEPAPPPQSLLLPTFVLPGPALDPNGDSILGSFHPPSNFAMVQDGIYRSSFPRKENYKFLKSLGIKSVLTLVLEKYPAETLDFYKEEGIKFMQFSIPGNKEPFVHIPEEKVRMALKHILDVRNHPMLIHCNKGKHRTGCVVGCIRKLEHWSLTEIFNEYRQFSYPKSRSMDQQFIELFDLAPVWDMIDPDFAPEWIDLRK